MRLLLPLLLLLAACDAPLEEAFPPKSYLFEEDGTTYAVRTQFDPFEFSWFSRVSIPDGALGPDDRQRAVTLVEQRLGPEVCDGEPLFAHVGQVWSGFGAERIRYLPTLGAWQIVADCD